MFGVERKFPQMYRKLKKILFHENLRIIYGNSRSQKTSCSALSMLSSIFQRPHVIRWLLPFDDAKVQHFSSDFKHIHYRSKTVQNQWISRRFRSFPFKLVQRFYGRTSKHPQDVRPYPLRTYVHRPFERTSTAPLVVRP